MHLRIRTLLVLAVLGTVASLFVAPSASASAPYELETATVVMGTAPVFTLNGVIGRKFATFDSSKTTKSVWLPAVSGDHDYVAGRVRYRQAGTQPDSCSPAVKFGARRQGSSSWNYSNIFDLTSNSWTVTSWKFFSPTSIPDGVWADSTIEVWGADSSCYLVIDYFEFSVG